VLHCGDKLKMKINMYVQKNLVLSMVTKTLYMFIVISFNPSVMERKTKSKRGIHKLLSWE
jgi:hypothetical protein